MSETNTEKTETKKTTNTAAAKAAKSKSKSKKKKPAAKKSPQGIRLSPSVRASIAAAGPEVTHTSLAKKYGVSIPTIMRHRKKGIFKNKGVTKASGADISVVSTGGSIVITIPEQFLMRQMLSRLATSASIH
jgi:hypothetical protein